MTVMTPEERDVLHDIACPPLLTRHQKDPDLVLIAKIILRIADRIAEADRLIVLRDN